MSFLEEMFLFFTFFLTCCLALGVSLLAAGTIAYAFRTIFG